MDEIPVLELRGIAKQFPGAPRRHMNGRGKWLAVVALAGASALLVVGCGGGDEESAGGTTTTGRAIKAGLVSDVGRFNDKGFNQFQLEGLQRAKRELGVQIRAVESRSAGDYLPNFSSMARQNFDIIIGAGFLLADAENTIAKQFPDAHFAITDYSIHAPPFADTKGNPLVQNVAGLTYATQENSYLAGCLAALMVKDQGGKQIISVVGGVKIPPVDAFLAGYEAGAKKCVPGMNVLKGYSQDFIDQAKCKSVASNQIGQGSQVVFNVAGPCGLGALDAANENNVWGIGVDKDQSFLGPHILTSVVKRVDVGIFQTIKLEQEGKFKGGTDLVFNLKNNGVSLGKMSPKVPQEFLDRIDGLKQDIIDGTIKPPTLVR
jgi:basic membrane protein A and related proteins